MDATAKNGAPTQGYIPQWTFADRIRKVRRDKGLTIEQMAVALQVGDKRYAAWESGRNTPADIADIAVRLEEISGVPRAWFLGWLNEEGPASEETGPRTPAFTGGGSFFVRPPGLEPGTHWLRADAPANLHPRKNRARDRPSNQHRNTAPKGRRS